MLKFSTSSHLS
jgi:hypothetical protein